MNDDSRAGTVLATLIWGGSLFVAGGTTLVARYTASTAGLFPLTIVGGALITWRIVAGWASGWFGKRIRHDLRAGSVGAYGLMIMAGIVGLALFGGIAIQVNISSEGGANGLFLYAAFAYVCTLGVVVALYGCCLMYSLRKHGVPPAQPPASR